MKLKGEILPGKLICKLIQTEKWDIVEINGIEGNFSSLKSYALTILLNNPNYETITDNFGISILKKRTNMIFESNMSIPGITVIPSSFTNISLKTLENFKITRNKLMWFVLRFKPSINLSPESLIKLTFPVSLKVQKEIRMRKSQSYKITRGLNDIDPFNPILIDFNEITNQMIISNY